MSIQTSSVRLRLEARERNILASWATLSEETRGRTLREEEDPHRTAFQRDRDRILHAKSFRRLKRKTQVFLAPEGDHYRTRLTHTLEVAQIARSIARALFLNEDLTEAIALGHDLGHTPFGHAGESVLNEVYEPGFRHYEQSLRVVDILERRSQSRGLNLTAEVRDGILHHSTGKAILRGEPVTGPATPEGMIVSVSDAIAYINHDIEDAVRAGIITLDDLPRDALFKLGRRSSQRINAMVVAIIESSGPDGIRIDPTVLAAMNELRDYLYGAVYPSEAIEGEIRKARKMLKELYHYLLNHPPNEVLQADPDDSLERSTVDFVAGMTDEYALRLYRKLILPGPWK